MPDLDTFLSTLAETPWIASARRLATSRAQGEIEVQGQAPLKGKLESVIGYPDRMAVTIDTGTLRIRQILNGGRSWIVQNNTVITGNPELVKMLQNNLFHNLNNLYRYLTDPANRGRLSLAADNGHRVIAIARDGESSEIAFDAELRIREVSFKSAAAGGQVTDNRIAYEEFKPWHGLFYPAVVAVAKDGKPLSRIVHTAYEGDVAVAADLFDQPAH